MKTSNKEKAIAFTEGFATDAVEILSYLNPQNYTEHELNAIDGMEGMKGLLSILPKDSPKPKIFRALEDGDIVFTQTEYNFFGRQIAIDVFRFEDGLIVEHWDNIQAFAEPNPSGRTLIDGEIEIKDLDRTAQNKELVRNFVQDILIDRKLDNLERYFSADNYIQHNPLIADGLSSFRNSLKEWSDQNSPNSYDTIHQVYAEGNFVLVISEGFLAGKHTSFYDLFRIENGKIAEHWDIIQEIPARETWKNNNGKF